ncbi:hypothetical protein [Streptomyces sp. NPDC023838]|uniref:hypothetical protein n=1 Tax=Streptomyces sp. NPDC023838 TaxID=3154325 RepID=UPI003407E4DA
MLALTPSRRLAAASAAAVTVGLLLGACTADTDGVTRRSSSWKKGAGAPDAAAFMKIRIPRGATEVTGAVRVQPQEDVYLLSFLTDEKTAESITADLRPDHPLKAVHSTSSLSGDGFQHLGLKPPQDLPGVRTTSACPPCVGDSRRSGVQGVEVHVGGGGGERVRLYLAAY